MAGSSAKPMKYEKGNTAGKRQGMHKGDAPAPGHSGGPSRGKVHDAGFSYAEYAKSEPKAGGGKGKM